MQIATEFIKERGNDEGGSKTLFSTTRADIFLLQDPSVDVKTNSTAQQEITKKSIQNNIVSVSITKILQRKIIQIE